MKTKIISFSLLTFITLSCPMPVNAQPYQGVVFSDSNNNGMQDNREAGIAGIKVSDGYNVVVSDSKGRFSLPGWDKARFITVYQPADYSCSQWFIPVEQGKPFSFAMQYKLKKEEVSFVQISDTETFLFGDWLSNLKAYADINQPDFIVHTGDICYKRGMKWHSDNVTTETLGVPVYYCLGNHDLVAGDYGEQFFEQHFGPAWYAFEENNTLFIVTPMMGGDYKPSFTRKDIGGWLKSLLKSYPASQSKIIFNHDLLTNGDQFVFHISKKDSINLNAFNLKAWLYGHWHINMVKEHGSSGVKSYGTAVAAKGGIDHSPSNFRVVDVNKKGDTRSALRWTSVNREIEVVSPINKDVVWNEDKLDVSVNVYHSAAEVEKVRYRIWPAGEGPDSHKPDEPARWQWMNRASDWNWRHDYVTDELAPGAYTLTIDAFMKGGDVLHHQVPFSFKNRETQSAQLTDNWFNLLNSPGHHADIDVDIKPNLRLSWSTNLGANIFISSPLIFEGKVFASTFDDGIGENAAVIALNGQTGQELWRFKTRNSVKNSMVIAGGLVIATDMQGYTYALDAKTGNLAWEKDLQYNRLPGFVSGLVTDGEVVFTGFGNTLCALDANSGKELWRNTAWNGGEGSVPVMTLADNILVASAHWRGLYGHDARTGKLIWERKDEGLRFRDGTVTYADNALWLAQNEEFFRLDVQTGKTLERFKTGMRHAGNSAPILTDSLFILGSSHPGVAAFNRSSLTRKWLFEVNPALLYTPPYYGDKQQTLEVTPLLLGDKLFFGASDGNLYLIDKNAGTPIWKKSLGAPVLTTAAFSGNSLFVCDFAGNVYCFWADMNLIYSNEGN